MGHITSLLKNRPKTKERKAYMNKMWAGRQTKETDKMADDFNSSIHFDSRMYRHDVMGSIAHATMLAHQGIISMQDKEQIVAGLGAILEDIEKGVLQFDLEAEDIHMFIESELTARIGDAGKRLHTARSRNDQVAVDIRLYLRDEVDALVVMVKELVEAVKEQAKANKDAIMPGYTHLQRAQPIVFGQHLLAYCMMLMRDVTRLEDARDRMNYSPLGSCALSGTTYNTDRRMTAELLGFDGIMENSMDGVSDRDFALELMSAFSIIMMHLSRFSEEIILWSSWEFAFIELDDAYTTGSSIMPQKKNSDMAELVRGKTGRVYGDLFALLTVLKGLPLAYNKDMQEDKEAIFDSLDTVKKCVEIFIPMIKTMKVKRDNMYKAACRGFINATDLADYLVASKGIPFRTAYKITGGIIGYCIEKGKILDDLTLEEYKSFSDSFDEGVYDAIKLENCIARRISEGSTGYKSVEQQILLVENFLTK